MAALVAALVILVRLPVDLPGFVATGLQAWGCAERTLRLASLPWLSLLVAQRRGAHRWPSGFVCTAPGMRCARPVFQV